jgi:soluble lytic murein transglycosylase-like protein
MQNPNEEYINRINNNLTKESVEQIISSVSKYSYRYNISEDLIYAIIHTESRFNVGAISETRDYGLMQLNKNTAKEFTFNKQMLLNDIDYSILCGTHYLSYLRRTYKEDKLWWARYHSSTKEFKNKYVKRIMNAVRIRNEIRSNKAR